MTKTYITYYFPGLLFAATASEKVKNRNIPKLLPRNCYGFQFYDITESVIKGEKLTGKSKNYSKMYLIGVKKTVAKIPATERNKILISNLNCNNKGIGVECHTGNWQGWDEKVEVLPVSQFKFEDRWV